MKVNKNVIINEDTLVEGPFGNFMNGIMNKVDPKGAKKRELATVDKEAKKIRNNAEVTLAKDFNTKNKNAKFYPGGKGFKNYLDWDEWRNTYSSVDVDDPKYAEWYNGIVVDEYGYFIRRGAEDLSKSLTKFIPGKNTDIRDMYKWDAAAVQAQKKDAEITDDSTQKVDKAVDNDDTSTANDSNKQDDKTNEPETKSATKADTSASSSKPTQPIKLLSRDDVNNSAVVFNKKKYKLSDLIAHARKTNFIEEFDITGYSDMFISVDDLISSIASDMSDVEVVEQCSELDKIAGLLQLSGVEDLVCYVDGEFIYDPTPFDPSHYRVDYTPIVCCVNDITLVAQNVQGTLCLYFASEDDGNSYLKYIEESQEIF